MAISSIRIEEKAWRTRRVADVTLTRNGKSGTKGLGLFDTFSLYEYDKPVWCGHNDQQTTKWSSPVKAPCTVNNADLVGSCGHSSLENARHFSADKQMSAIQGMKKSLVMPSLLTLITKGGGETALLLTTYNLTKKM